jgi:hypothetical protein
LFPLERVAPWRGPVCLRIYVDWRRAIRSGTLTGLTFARRLANVDNLPQQDSAQTAFNKLARTFAAQVSALKDYRSKGEQKMTVQHVHVAEGGQAIVGNVSAPGTGGRGAGKSEGTTPCIS